MKTNELALLRHDFAQGFMLTRCPFGCGISYTCDGVAEHVMLSHFLNYGIAMWSLEMVSIYQTQEQLKR